MKPILLPLIEDPSEATLERESCKKCGIGSKSNCNSPVMACYIPDGWTGLVLVIAEAPGEDEDKKGRPMVGKAGKLLFQLLADVGIGEKDVALTNANRCWPGPGNPTPNLTQIRLCRPFVASDVLRLRPKWTLALGDNAIKAVFNSDEKVKRHRQRVYDGAQFFGDDASGLRVVFSYHPASCFYQDGAAQREKIREDLKWLVGFKGYVQAPDEAPPTIEEHVGLDIEWGSRFELLTVGQAVGQKAIATEDKATWTKWFDAWGMSGLEPYVVGHSIFGDLPIMRINGLSLPSTWISGEKARDSLLLARLENENRGAYDLESLSVSISGIEPWKSKSDSLTKKGKKRISFSELPPDIRADRCRLDAWATERVGSSVISQLNPTVVSFTHRLAALLKRVEMAGVKISPERYEGLKQIISSHLEDRRAALKTLAASYGLADFETSNDNHFRDLLYNRIGATVERRTPKDKLPAVDHPAMVLLYQEGTPAIKDAVLARLRHEKVDKLYSTYIGRKNDTESVGLAKHLTDNWFVFQNINPLGARTGRRSSDNPNMQNWPKRIRAMAVSRYPGGVICKGDESQLEPRILAYMAGIDEWQELFDRGGNLYLHTAKKLWKRDVVKEDEFYRMTKSTVLGTNYGMEVDLFMEKMAVEQGILLTRDQALFLLNGYHGLYPQLPRYFARQKEILLRDQQISTLTGQIRHLPCPEGERTKGFKHLWNQALNFPIQGLAAFVTGSAALDLESAILGRLGLSLSEHYDNLVRFWAEEKLGLDKDPNGWYTSSEKIGKAIDYPLIVNEVHDELVLDTPGKDKDWILEAIAETMSACQTLRNLWPATKSLRLKADTQIASSWAG